MTEKDAELPTSLVLADIIHQLKKNPNGALAATAMIFIQIGREFEQQLIVAGSEMSATAVADVIQTQAVPILRPQ